MQKAVNLPASINSTSYKTNLSSNKFWSKIEIKIFTQFPLLAKHFLASLGPGFDLERQMLIFVQRLSACVQFSFFTALFWRAAQALAAAALGASHSVYTYCNCVFIVGFDFFFLKKAANLNSPRYLNNVPEFSTAFREQLSLWCVAPVQRRRLHFWTCKPLFHKQTGL